MKIAICISGQLRHWEEGYASLKENILDHNDCMVFMQTYDTEEARIMIDTIGPDITLIEPNIADFTISDSVKENKAPETNLENMYWMYRNIKRCDQLLTPETHFDAVLRTRFDLKYPNPIDLLKFDTSKIWIPSGGDWGGGLFDMVAFSSPENMRYYSSLIDHIEEYNKEGTIAHPETMLRRHLRDKEVGRFDFPINVFRDNGLWFASQ
jgi:hypothetical protein